MTNRSLIGSVDEGNRGNLKGNLNSTRMLHGAISSGRKIEGSVSKTSYTVDAELSETSTNPVQNKVVTAALGKKMENLNFAKNSDLDFMFK